MRGALFILAGLLLVASVAANLSDPAPSAALELALGVALVAAGVWLRVRDRRRHP